MLTVKNLFESTDGFFQIAENPGVSGKLLCHEEWLTKESLDLSGPGNRKLLLISQFVHTKNRDNVFQVL